MINLLRKNKKGLPNKNGFAMLFTVLLVTLVLTIALGISSVVYKQIVLSSLSKDSQIAFYQADSGAECGLFYDISGMFPFGSRVSTVPANIVCGLNTMTLVVTESSNNYFVYKNLSAPSSGQCYEIVFDKRNNPIFKVQSYGYNLCGSNPRQVERAVEIQY